MPKLTSNYIDPKSGEEFRFEYEEANNFDNLDIEQVRQVYGVCFEKEKMVVVRTELNWHLPGGTREIGESVEQTLFREIQEETNMEVIEWKPVGIQTVYANGQNPYLQLRVAAKVKPLGDFVSDPDGDILEIKLINPLEYRKYFDWGEIGEAIIQKATRIYS